VPNFPLRKHRDSLYSSKCQHSDHVENGCRTMQRTCSDRFSDKKRRKQSEVAIAKVSDIDDSDSDTSFAGPSIDSVCKDIW
jgi:hypothetical protein